MSASTESMNPEVMRQILLAAETELKDREDLEARRAFTLSSTVHFAETTGASVMNPKQGMYPWLPYAENFANYLDQPAPRGVAVPIKPGFIARLHLKTSIAGEALARFALANPEKRNAIFSWDFNKAAENLTQIAFDYKTEELQELFPEVLYPDDTKGRYYYTKKSVMLKRKGNYKEPSILALGESSNRTGKHFNGVIWIDDVVTEDNYRNPEVQKQIWDTIQYIINCIAEPGCQIWITGTRYVHYDAYMNLLSKNSPVKHQVIPGYPNMGCWEEQPDGTRKSLFYWKYCVKPEEKMFPVKHKGKTYTPTRSSLEEMRDGMDPVLWSAQFLNSPIVGGTATFSSEDFGNIAPCNGVELDDFLRSHGDLIDPSETDRGLLNFCIPGDPAYSDRNHNDNSVLLTVAQDRFDYWYVCEARVTRDGWKGLENYLKQSFCWHKVYGNCELAIEAHAKESLLALSRRLEREYGINPRWNPLKENSGGRNGPRKNERIATALEELIRGGRLWFCIPDGAGDRHPVELFRQMLIKEAMEFPNSLHDDALDCLSNSRQSFRLRFGDKPKSVDFFPRRDRLPRGVRKWLVA